MLKSESQTLSPHSMLPARQTPDACLFKNYRLYKRVGKLRDGELKILWHFLFFSPTNKYAKS